MENQQLKKSQSPLQIARKKFMKNKTAMAATIVLGMIVIISFLAPFIAPHDPNVQNLVLIKGDMSLEHWLGRIRVVAIFLVAYYILDVYH